MQEREKREKTERILSEEAEGDKPWTNVREIIG